ncbi:acyl-CoA dehydrogenase family protein [Sphingomicrobium astaxanthinifaciens]|uniref:acyl-CoA dehydrogenase family protein n=1 Tax=Sphingomicrobium astaxanthinifaciens TaxID=1227949 RepID=UPI001FCBA702|nr:acyl-CoA dehydrogenase family protein [Sphingomicrobium astaxanthinifaciens]MCJ7421745.1 acyl-CoA dehydrogenase family protein [Sphingomicrobium astaxanthinifaciens]
MPDLESFARDIRSWLEDNVPASMRTPMKSEKDICWGGRDFVFQSEDQKAWLDKAAAKGWTVPDWPKEYGGGGLGPEETKILRAEMKRMGVRTPLTSFGISMLGPALLKFGTEEQKQRFLPPIARGEIRWCQGYSEPGAGSDLAGLATRAEDKGDHYLVNGQKVWTSYADQADWIFCLVRTSKESKHGGISFLLFDMASEGVSTRPIKLISGLSPFCETFFDDVKVPKDQLVHKENEGWTVAKYLLGHEREMISGMGLGGGAGSSLMSEAIPDADPILAADLARFDVDALAFQAMSEAFIDKLKAGEAHPAEPSMMKYAGTELNKRRHELVMQGGGSDALEWESERSKGGAKPRDWLRTKGNSIEGGTSEIQLGIIAKHILQLPGA